MAKQQNSYGLDLPQWLNVPQAAELAECSEKTVRRRAKRRTYRSRYVKGEFGDELLVHLGDVLKGVHPSRLKKMQAQAHEKTAACAPTPGQDGSEKTPAAGGLTGNVGQNLDDRTILKVLIVDDSKEAAAMTAKALKGRRAEVVGIAQDGVTALEMVLILPLFEFLYNLFIYNML